tara:strand:- start:20056 stop:20277 length:222 start_codon:yes stop_codon:yes gene_type:complete
MDRRIIVDVVNQTNITWSFLLLFEVTLLVKLDPDANFIASDSNGASSGLEDVLVDTIYDIDDVEIIEIEVKEK